MNHLSPERLKALLDGAKAEPELLAHLKDGCDACEAVLQEAQVPALEGATDRVLLSLAKGAAVEDEVRAAATYARIRPAVVQPARRWPLALAAGLVLVLGAGLFLARPKPVDEGLKGGPALSLELFAAVKQSDGTVQRVENGATVSSSGVLLLRYHASEAATGYVVVERPHAQREALGPVTLSSGTHDLSRDGELVGLSLAEGEGALGVWLVAAPGATGPTREAALAALDSRAAAEPLKAVGFKLNVGR